MPTHKRVPGWAVVGGFVVGGLLIYGIIRTVTVLGGFADGKKPTVIARRDPVPDQPRRSIRHDEIREKLLAEFDLSNLRVERDEIVQGARWKDAIVSVTSPPRVAVGEQNEWAHDTRVIEVQIGGDAVAYPIAMLNVHEIFNDVVGKVPVAVTYCPLCDAALVIDRRIQTAGGETETLEFGVSGFLINSNVVMYDRTDQALWSQLLMEAISGPNAGVKLTVLPVRVTSLAEFVEHHSDGEVVSGYLNGVRRPYEQSMAIYAARLAKDELPFDVPKRGRALPDKTLGLGILAGDQAIFVPRDALPEEGASIDTPRGPVTIRSSTTGVVVDSMPDAVGVVQTFYYAWSAYHPRTTIFGREGRSGAEALATSQPQRGSNENSGPRLEAGSMFDMNKILAFADLDVSNLTLDPDDITGVTPIDAIPALTDPQRAKVGEAKPLPDDARLIVVTHGNETVAYPLLLLNYHEVINDVVGETPIAVTYCPLCDAAAVFDRRIAYTNADGESGIQTLRFGVTGLLGHGNVLFYDKADRALWSQLQMEAISGPHVGTRLETLPFSMSTWSEFSHQHDAASVATLDTSYARDYFNSPYKDYLRSTGLLFAPRDFGRALPPKTLGVGIVAGKRTIFVPAGAIGAIGLTVETDLGPVRLTRSEAGVSIESFPASVRAVQSFYFGWSAHHPQTEIFAPQD